MTIETGEAEVNQGETSEETKQTSIEETPEFKKALSDHLAKAGREAKTLAEQKAELEKEKQSLAQWRAERERAEQERELAELREAENDAESETEKQRVRKAKAYVEKQIAKAQAERERLTELEKTINEKSSLVEKLKAFERNETLSLLAKEKNVDLDALKKAAGVINDASVLSEIADLLPKVQPKEMPKNDSGKTSGNAGGKTPTIDELRQSNPFDTARKVKSGEWVL